MELGAGFGLQACEPGRGPGGGLAGQGAFVDVGGPGFEGESQPAEELGAVARPGREDQFLFDQNSARIS